jgi:tyrosyl-tRNA synthetase
VFADAPSTDLPAGRLDGVGELLVDLLAETGLVKSKSQSRTTVSQGGAYVNNGRADDVEYRVTSADLVAGRYLVLRRGKKDHHLVRFA